MLGLTDSTMLGSLTESRSVEDAVWYLSWLFAASNALDKATLLAELVCSDSWVHIRFH